MLSGGLRDSRSSANRGHLLTRNESRPFPSPPFGWREHRVERYSESGEPVTYTDWRASGDVVGWIDGDELYLEASSAFAMVKRMATDNGLTLPIPTTQLGKKLKERGLLRSTRAAEENKAQTTISGRTIATVFHLSAQQALGVSAQEHEGKEDQEGGRTQEQRRQASSDTSDDDLPF